MTFDITDPIFTDENAARVHLEAQRWPHGPICQHCGEAEQITKLEGKKHRPGVYQCNSCRKQFTVTVGTVFERSKIPLHKWLLATYLLSASKKGMSSHQLHRMLGVTYKTAWFMTHRIREAMREPAGAGPLGGPNTVVEVDETFVGGSINEDTGRAITTHVGFPTRLDMMRTLFRLRHDADATKLDDLCEKIRSDRPALKRLTAQK